MCRCGAHALCRVSFIVHSLLNVEGGEMEDWREVDTRRMGRAALEGGLGRGSYVVGAQWDEGNMVHAMRRFGGKTVGWRFGDG